MAGASCSAANLAARGDGVAAYDGPILARIRSHEGSPNSIRFRRGTCRQFRPFPTRVEGFPGDAVCVPERIDAGVAALVDSFGFGSGDGVGAEVEIASPIGGVEFLRRVDRFFDLGDRGDGADVGEALRITGSYD